WSVYTHDATVTATFEMSDGALFVYNGTWNARGLPTYWNSEWRIGAQHGTATWDGTGAPVLGTEDQEETRALNTALEEALSTSEPDQIDASIIEFVTSVREGRRPMCEVHDNILSFAMVEAAVAPVGSLPVSPSLSCAGTGRTSCCGRGLDDAWPLSRRWRQEVRPRPLRIRGRRCGNGPDRQDVLRVRAVP